MLVVSNTSPLSNLAIIGRLEWLMNRYRSVTVPPLVRAELSALSNPSAKAALDEAFRKGWLSVDSVDPSFDWSAFLEVADPGECEAIALAETKRADKILLDDRAGRELARQRGLRVSGLLGELLYAKKLGWIDSVRHEMKELREKARFFVHESLEAMILAEAGE